MDIKTSAINTNVMQSAESMKSMRLSYDLNIDEIFEKKLMRLEKSKTKKLSLLTIQLNTIDINADEVGIDIPIGRTRITKDGKVFCESMVCRSQFFEHQEEEEENTIIFESIRVLSNNNVTAAAVIAVEDKVDIDFDALETSIILFSVSFTTKYPKAIKKIFPHDPKDAFLYALYDEGNIEGNIGNSDKVSFYTEKNFTGQCYTYKIGDSIDFTNIHTNPLNDKFKSAKVGSKCKLIVWADGGYSGPTKTLLEDTADLNLSNKGLSSFVITYR